MATYIVLNILATRSKRKWSGTLSRVNFFFFRVKLRIAILTTVSYTNVGKIIIEKLNSHLEKCFFLPAKLWM